MRVLGCRISDDDNSMTIDWYEESEHTIEGGMVYQTIITAEALSSYHHVKYFAEETIDDLTELVGWYEKYRRGLYSDKP